MATLLIVEQEIVKIEHEGKKLYFHAIQTCYHCNHATVINEADIALEEDWYETAYCFCFECGTEYEIVLYEDNGEYTRKILIEEEEENE